jgi:hypothetical protein
MGKKSDIAYGVLPTEASLETEGLRKKVKANKPAPDLVKMEIPPKLKKNVEPGAENETQDNEELDLPLCGDKARLDEL